MHTISQLTPYYNIALLHKTDNGYSYNKYNTLSKFHSQTHTHIYMYFTHANSNIHKYIHMYLGMTVSATCNTLMTSRIGFSVS